MSEGDSQNKTMNYEPSVKAYDHRSAGYATIMTKYFKKKRVAM